MSNEKSIAIITARGGSKRIPRKNIRPFLGRPIIEYSIRAAKEAGIFSEVMVSTDDQEIAEVARTAGASVPFLRSAKAADDHATTADVIIEVLREYQKAGQEFGTYCCIYPTAPFVTGAKLRQAHQILRRAQATALIPVVRFGYPIQRALAVQDGFLGFMDPRHVNSRSQDLPPAYHDCGQFYFGQSEAILRTGRLFPEKTVPFILPETEVQDIDHEEDWVIAELKYRLLKESGKVAP